MIFPYPLIFIDIPKPPFKKIQNPFRINSFCIKKEKYLPQLKKILNDSKIYSLNVTLRNERKAHINAYSLKNRYISIIITYLDENDEL